MPLVSIELILAIAVSDVSTTEHRVGDYSKHHIGARAVGRNDSGEDSLCLPRESVMKPFSHP